MALLNVIDSGIGYGFEQDNLHEVFGLSAKRKLVYDL